MAAKIDRNLEQAAQAHRAGDLRAAERHYRQTLKRRANHADATAGLADVLARTGRIDEAIATLVKATRVRPQRVDLHIALVRFLLGAGRPREALNAMKTALSANPKDPSLFVALGDIYLQRFNPERAINAYRQALEVAPDRPDTHAKLADALFDHGMMDDAIDEYRTALEYAPDDLDLRTNLATALRIKGRHEEAILEYDRVAAADPNIPEVLAGRAEILESRGETDAAYALLENPARNAAPNPTLAAAFARVSRRAKKLDPAIDAVRRALRATTIEPRDKAMLYFNLGALHEAADDADRAFNAYRNANDLAPKTFDRDAYAGLIDEVIDAFSPDRVASYPRSDVESELPVFIVGMPRSGTSLVEQILASHPQVYGAGELSDITNLVITLPERLGADRPYPALLDAITPKQMNDLARERLERLRALDPDATRITDKMPHNFSHLGLINLLFPKARVIHCSRDPIDTCLSCYTTQLPLHHSYKSDLEDLAFAYGQYRRLMAHWREVIDLPLFEAPYERMVDEQESMSRELVDFIGLEWDDACLRFYESKRIVATASLDQVRRPVYRSSVGRAERFGEHLRPLRDALDRVLTA
ncbi:MAG: tetratricopeptide repeat-containing sulfotransferase family protein [Phycisphaerales bacterium]